MCPQFLHSALVENGDFVGVAYCREAVCYREGRALLSSLQLIQSFLHLLRQRLGGQEGKQRRNSRSRANNGRNLISESSEVRSFIKYYSQVKSSICYLNERVQQWIPTLCGHFYDTPLLCQYSYKLYKAQKRRNAW